MNENRVEKAHADVWVYVAAENILLLLVTLTSYGCLPDSSFIVSWINE